MSTTYTDINKTTEESVGFLRTISRLLAHLEEPYLVGGFLRDVLCGRATRDVDIVVEEDAISIARQMALDLDASLVILDESRRIARVIVGQKSNITGSYKEDWHIDLASLQGGLYNDLSRRDFTIDAMAVPLRAYLKGDWFSDLVDPFGGCVDLEQRLIRFTGKNVFKEDSIRMLRGVRLASALGFNIDEETSISIKCNVDEIKNASAERVRDEFLSILSLPHAVDSIYLMDELGLLSKIMPELEAGRGVEQPKEHYWDVFKHNLETVGSVEGLIGRTLEEPGVLEAVFWNNYLENYFNEVVSDGHNRLTLCKLAGLLHDVAKPITKTIENSGKMRFFGHSSEGADIARAILERMRFSSRGVQMVTTMIDLHLRPGQMSDRVELPTARAIYRYFRHAGEVALDTLYLNMADYIAARGPYLKHDEWVEYARMVMHILSVGFEQQEVAVNKGLINGNDVMGLLRIGPGPEVGKILNLVNESYFAGEVATRDAAIKMVNEFRGENNA